MINIKEMQVIIVLISIMYQIWLMLTVSLMFLFDNWNLNFLPNFVERYVKCIYLFIDKPWNIPFFAWVLFISGGICMGITLGVNAVNHFKKWHEALW